jgi:hypothetical protein
LYGTCADDGAANKMIASKDKQFFMFLNLPFGTYAKNHLGGQEFQLQPLGVLRMGG